MITRSRRAFWVVALLLLTITVLLGSLAWQPQTLGPANAESPPLSMQWRPGAMQHYRFVVDSSVRMQSDGAAKSAPTTHNVRGVLAVETIAVATDGIDLRMQLDPVQLSVGGVVDHEASRELACGFQVRCLPSGMPIRFAFPATVAPAQAEQLEQLLRTFQFEVRSESAWQAEESHGSGAYLARYQREGAGEIRRTKLRYVKPPSWTPDAALVQVLAAEATAQLAPGVDWLRANVVREVLRTTTELGMTFEVTTDGELTWLPAAEAETARIRSALAAAIDDLPKAQSMPTDSERQSVTTGRPAAELAEALKQLVAGLDAAVDRRATLVHRLRDLIQQDARAPAMLLVILQQQELQDRTRANLFLAFELGGTEAAQEVLCQVATGDTWRSGDRTRALVALGGLTQPTNASLSALWATTRDRTNKQTSDHANTAALALGALGSRMDHATSDDYANLREGLLAAALGAPDDRARAIAILALGNTADQTLGEEVARFLDHETPSVRRAAAKTLGKYGNELAAVELMLRLREEPSSKVRAAMAGALTQCATAPAEAMPIVRAAVAREPDELARLALARFLTRDLASHPDNVTALRQLLAVERSGKVRRMVGEALAAHDAAQRRELGGPGGG